MAIPIQPRTDYVVAQAEATPTKTATGLYLPTSSSAEKPVIATVVAVGPGAIDKDGKRVPVELKIGDRIVYKSFSTTTVKVGDADYIIVREEDVLATVK